ncbi:phytase [Nonlabens sp.]|uniref:phytase n=1 Tax=Nonlabens sp. TaxID=1888209 RepID=UPI0025DFC78A|nr:phytase [Nonlabens sp.]
MTYLKRINFTFLTLCTTALLFHSCSHRLPEIPPSVITEKTPHDTDDPAIWVNQQNPEKSMVFGTDKDPNNGGVYAFDLKGRIISEKSLTGLSYPNNVAIAYDFKINDSTLTDIMMFTEREKNQIRLFSVPDMKALDNGGFPVFTYETDSDNRRPMGIALYKDQLSNKMYAIVSRKVGPKLNYLAQYHIVANNSIIQANLVRKFGHFSGKKEIEAIAVDQELGFVYYADEMNCIRKYYASPEKGDVELSCFGGDYFERDIEGIAIVKQQDHSGYLVVSNQQAQSFSVFDRKTNDFIKELNLGTRGTDGCDATSAALGTEFPNGLLVSMNNSKEFYYHDLRSIGLD